MAGRPAGGDEPSLARINRDSVANFYRSHYKPEDAILAVVGDLDSAEMEQLLAARFAPWTAGGVRLVENIGSLAPQKSRLLLVDKPDSTQTYFRIGNVGISRTNTDYVPLLLVNTLFGGRFTSLINSALRIESGLTYGASSAFDTRVATGAFFISSYTPNASTGRALDITVEVLKRFHENGISEQQLASAKSYVKGQFPLRIETSDQVASLIAQLEFHGLDRREIDDLYAKIDAITPADACRVIEQYYPQDDLVFVLIGKASEIGEVAGKYASHVDLCSITEPGFYTLAASRPDLRAGLKPS